MDGRRPLNAKCLHIAFRVQGSGFRVQGLGFRVQADTVRNTGGFNTYSARVHTAFPGPSLVFHT